MHMAHFSWLTILLLALGWLTHWLILVRKAQAAARAARTELPDLWDYWTADRPSTALSLIGVIVVYFVVPSFAARWPDLAAVIGATEDDPLNPLAAYLGGLAAPWLADLAGRRLAGMVGDLPQPSPPVLRARGDRDHDAGQDSGV